MNQRLFTVGCIIHTCNGTQVLYLPIIQRNHTAGTRDGICLASFSMVTPTSDWRQWDQRAQNNRKMQLYRNGLPNRVQGSVTR